MRGADGSAESKDPYLPLTVRVQTLTLIAAGESRVDETRSRHKNI